MEFWPSRPMAGAAARPARCRRLFRWRADGARSARRCGCRSASAGFRDRIAHRGCLSAPARRGAAGRRLGRHRHQGAIRRIRRRDGCGRQRTRGALEPRSGSRRRRRHEVRTTVHPALTPPATMENLARELAARGIERWVLQPFRAAGCANEDLVAAAASAAKLDHGLLTRLARHVPGIEVRG